MRVWWFCRCCWQNGVGPLLADLDLQRDVLEVQDGGVVVQHLPVHGQERLCTQLHGSFTGCFHLLVQRHTSTT